MKTRMLPVILIIFIIALMIIGSSASALDIEMLLKAVIRGDASEVKRLIEEGADVNAQNQEGYTALMWATHYGYSEFAKFLIDEGADINIQDTWGHTALEWALRKGHPEIAELLREAGAKE